MSFVGSWLGSVVGAWLGPIGSKKPSQSAPGNIFDARFEKDAREQRRARRAERDRIEKEVHAHLKDSLKKKSTKRQEIKVEADFSDGSLSEALRQSFDKLNAIVAKTDTPKKLIATTKRHEDETWLLAVTCI